MTSQTLVFHFDRLIGVSAECIAFFSWWRDFGPFPLTIPEGGGLRNDAAYQEGLFMTGRSRAKTLDQTPHGRGGAVDAYPAKVVSGTVIGIHQIKDGSEAIERFEKFGALAEAKGLTWGGRWLRAFPPSKSNPRGGDCAHVESRLWPSLPFPPVLPKGASCPTPSFLPK